MEKYKVIVPTGYMGSGSSAITDLLDGIEGIDVSRSTFEFVFLHCPNGVFDLEDKLLIGNNAVRSDEAIHEFEKTMKQLYNKKYWWVGHYNKIIGREFWDITKAYISNIVEFMPEYYWYYQENAKWYMFPRLVYNKMLRKISGGRCFEKKALMYEQMKVSYITEDEFYRHTQDYIYKIFDVLGKKENSIVLDQLLLPFNLFRFGKYFKKDVEVFVVDRDPRDVFIANKYYWSQNKEPVPYPTDVEEFCDFYEKLRGMEKKVENPHVHRIHFEDLIYKYKETVIYILETVGMDLGNVDMSKSKFDPNVSISNTQTFLKNETYYHEAKVIEKKLQKYVYNFPHKIQHDDKEVF